MKVWISAGETSGDQLGAMLAKALQTRDGSLRCAGLAGPRMRAQGVAPIAVDPARFALAGWSAVLRDLPGLLRDGNRVLAEARRFRPDLVVFIDSPGLHRPMLRALRRDGVPCVWLAPPQLWAWKRRTVPELQGLDVYPLHAFEMDRLRTEGANPHWFGFPGPRPTPREARGDRDLLALLPGTRTSWRHRHEDLFRQAALRSGLPLETVLVVPDDRIPGTGEMRVTQALTRSAIALAMPGTGVLETCLAGIPTVVAAHPGWLDLRIARHALDDGVLSLPNRILGEAVCPEHLGRPTARELGESLRELWDRRDGVRSRLAALQESLGPEQAPDRLAEHLLR